MSLYHELLRQGNIKFTLYILHAHIIWFEHWIQMHSTDGLNSNLQKQELEFAREKYQAELTEKENKDWNYNGRTQNILRLLTFFLSIGINRENTIIILCKFGLFSHY